MKKILFLSTVIITSVSFSQIVVPETTKSLYGLVEATWCGNCGQYGHPATADIIAQTSPKAVYVGLHRSVTSELYSPSANDLATAFGAVGQPYFTLNGQALGPYTGTIVAENIAAIDAYYNAAQADVNAGFEYGIVGDSIYVHTTTTFFNDMDGEYYVACYVYEDSIWEWQVNYDPGIPDQDIWHNRILRTAIDGAFGDEIATGSINAGSSFNRNFKTVIDPAWDPGQLHVFTAVWKKNGSVYEFVNANDVGAVIAGQVNVEEQMQEQEISIYPNPVTDSFTVSGTVDQISVYDLAGDVVAASSAENTMTIHQLPAGTYIVRINSGGHCYYRKLVKQ